MEKRDYDAVRLNADLWHLVRAFDFEIHKLPADARRKLLDMQMEMRDIAWNHMQSLEIEWADRAEGEE